MHLAISIISKNNPRLPIAHRLQFLQVRVSSQQSNERKQLISRSDQRVGWLLSDRCPGFIRCTDSSAVIHGGAKGWSELIQFIDSRRWTRSIAMCWSLCGGSVKGCSPLLLGGCSLLHNRVRRKHIRTMQPGLVGCLFSSRSDQRGWVSASSGS